MLIKDQETTGQQISEEVTGYVSEKLLSNNKNQK
jgi:hypothetical protein